MKIFTARFTADTPSYYLNCGLILGNSLFVNNSTLYYFMLSRFNYKEWEKIKEDNNFKNYPRRVNSIFRYV